MTATLVEDEELLRLRSMAEGTRPFVRSALWEQLSSVDLQEFWKLPARERLAVGYYQAAKRRLLTGVIRPGVIGKDQRLWLKQGYREAGGGEPEGQVEDEGGEVQPALHNEAGGGAAD